MDQTLRNFSREEWFRELRAWCFDSGEPGFVADAFAHWVVETQALSALGQASWSDLKQTFNYDETARKYYRAHGARRIDDGWTFPERLYAYVADW